MATRNCSTAARTACSSGTPWAWTPGPQARKAANPRVARFRRRFILWSPLSASPRWGLRSEGLRAEFLDQGIQGVHLGGLQVGQRGAHRAGVVAHQLGAGLDDAHGVALATVADLQVGQEEVFQQAVLRGV